MFQRPHLRPGAMPGALEARLASSGEWPHISTGSVPTSKDEARGELQGLAQVHPNTGTKLKYTAMVSTTRSQGLPVSSGYGVQNMFVERISLGHYRPG